MWRRCVAHGRWLQPLLSQLHATRREATVPSDTREAITKRLAVLKEECRGQALDLSDMGDAVKLAAHGVADSIKPLVAGEHAKLRAKCATLAASVKVYTTRLSNLQHESQSIQGEVDALVKLMWGTENTQGASFASAPPERSSRATTQESTPSNEFDINIDPPPSPPSSTTPPPPHPSIERVDAEPVIGRMPDRNGSPSAATNGDENSVAADEIVVETFEVKVGAGETGAKPCEPASVAKGHEAEGRSAAAATTSNATASIADITRELFERGVDFSDCLDAQSLRRRYEEVLSRGTVSSGARQAGQTGPEPRPSPPSVTPTQPSMPERPRYYHNGADERRSAPPPPPNMNDGSLAADPYPNALRKLVDTSKFVWQLKQEIAKEQNFDPSTVDLWSNNIKLDDSKRIYDYPTAQHYPLEVRSR